MTIEVAIDYEVWNKKIQNVKEFVISTVSHVIHKNLVSVFTKWI